MSDPGARRLSLAARARYALAEHGPGPLLALLGVVADIVAGVALHFGALNLRTHLEFSVLIAGVISWASIKAIQRNIEVPAVRRTALLLMSLTFSQLVLGAGSFLNLMTPGTLAVFPIAHTMMALAVFVSALVLAVLTYRRIKPEDAELSHGGVAVA